MNSITQALLVGAALGALATVPAVAGDVPAFHVTALHAGNVVNKTMIREPGRTNVTSTIEVSTYIPASDLDKKVKLAGAYYTFPCSSSVKTRITKKTTYGKAGIYTETYSGGCGDGGYAVYGYTYKLTNPEGEGKTDNFVSSLIGKFENNGVKYKETLNVDVSVQIGE